jgi:serine/threonine-protein kinase RsbW
MHHFDREVCHHELPVTTMPVEGWLSYALHTTEEIDVFLNLLTDRLEVRGFSEHDVFGVRLAMEEAIVNSIKHGHHCDPSKEVHIRYHVTDACFLAEIEDEGPGFNPDEVPDPLAAENIEREGGRGLFLIRCYMTWVAYNETGNRLTLCKIRSGH